MYEIEKNVPIEMKTPILEKYPFSKMEVGDSFAVEGQERFVVRAAAYAFAQRHGFKFKTRAVSDNKTRVWRIK